MVKPNRHEIERFVNHEIRDEACLIDAGQRLSAVLDATALLVTLGEDGMLLFQSGLDPVRFPTSAQSVFDVTGAGDTATTVLTLALATGSPLGRAVLLANVAAGIVVGKSGTACVSVDELRNELR